MKKKITKEEHTDFRPIHQSGFGTGPIMIASLIGIASIICLVLTWPR